MGPIFKLVLNPWSTLLVGILATTRYSLARSFPLRERKSQVHRFCTPLQPQFPANSLHAQERREVRCEIRQFGKIGLIESSRFCDGHGELRPNHRSIEGGWNPPSVCFLVNIIARGKERSKAVVIALCDLFPGLDFLPFFSVLASSLVFHLCSSFSNFFSKVLWQFESSFPARHLCYT